ncbi:anthranilate 1,2-dioxygenase large subunit [Rhodobiaceae bacterium]|nr:anthranilate 1,2-dioxygenase large subunit [Rhodobiaceae bacterium]
MDHQLQVEILKDLMHQLDSGKNIDVGVQYKIPTETYACPDLAAKEWDTMFRNYPQAIGLSGALPEPGSFLTMEDFGAPILATRAKKGNFRAFLNACRHRATRVAMEPRGKRTLFTCPFHAWSYSNEGDLVAIPDNDHFGDVDKSCRGLIELPALEIGGLLWVHPQPNGKLDIEDLLGPLASEIASNHFEDLVYVGSKTIDRKLNWKLANDTFGETYHFQKLHKDTLGHIFYGNNTHYEEFGRNHRFTTANLGIDKFRELPESEWQINQGTFVDYHLFPNIQCIWSGDNVSFIRIYPDPENAGRSITQVDFYFSQAAVDAANAADAATKAGAVENVYERSENRVSTLESIMEVFNSTIEQEDYVMGEYQQIAAASGIAGDALIGRNEPVIHHYHRSYREALGLPPLETIEQPLRSPAD